jgi:hypothetical protein
VLELVRTKARGGTIELRKVRREPARRPLASVLEESLKTMREKPRRAA